MLSSLISTVSAVDVAEPLEPQSLAAALRAVPDPRGRRGRRYPLWEILAVVVCAVIAGSRSYTTVAEWAADAAADRPVTASGRVPTLPTIHRICTIIDADALDTAVTEWVRTQVVARAVAIDGKEVRGAKNGTRDRVFLMAALDHDTGTVIGQEAIDTKTNEIPHFPYLLDQLGDMTGLIVTADALHTQHGHAQLLHERGAHYVFTVKANQKRLRERISSQTWASLPIGHTVSEKGHGRTTTWQTTCQRAQPWIGFPHAAQTIRLTRDRTCHATGESTREHVFAITSLTPEDASPAALAALIRGHWGIENRLHWVRDVTYDEDRSQIRTGSGPRVMATIRNLAISIHRLTGATNIAKATRHATRNPEHARTLIGL